jgi:phage baseplate assembly protein W
MPLVKQQRKISPLDLNKNVTIGVAFPLNDTNMFRGTETVNEQNKSNLLNLLLTQQGERVNHPNFGVGLKNLLFEQNVDIDQLKEIIQLQTSRYVPGIKVTNVQTGISEDKHTIFVSIVYQNLLDAKTDAVKLNFS